VSVPLDTSLRALDDCGCCTGIRAGVPGVVFNRPGLSALAYRSATWHEFRSSLLAALSDPAHPQLAGLATRSDDDFTIALLDAVAAMGDVLTFYGERIASEAFLRTAVERRSILELARLIGYELRPGVAASTLLAFTVEDPPGEVSSALSPRITTVDAGVRVQSIPGQGEKPQTFETIEPIEARVEWNAMRPKRTTGQDMAYSPDALWFAGTATGLNPGDFVLIVAGVPGDPIGPNDWEARRVSQVIADFDADRTFARLEARPAESTYWPTLTRPVHVHALRTQASIFGHNAADWRTMSSNFKCHYLQRNDGCALTPTELANWPNFGDIFTTGAVSWQVTGVIELDAVHPISADSWLVLSSPGVSRLYNVIGASVIGRARFGISGKVSEVVIRGSGFTDFLGWRRAINVYAESEELELSEIPIFPPETDGSAQIVIDRPLTELPAGRRLLLTGTDADTGEEVSDEMVLDHLEDIGGYGVLAFTDAPDHRYLLDSLTIHGNVARATHGESAAEVLGAGNAARPFQQFTLKQPPLTHVRAPGATAGTASTLEVRVNDLRWEEVPSFHGRAPAEHVYTTRLDDEGHTVVQFGDGVHGARLPTGVENVRAAYRRGIGLGGNLDPGQLTTLLTKPLGIKEAINPIASTGGDDPEPRDAARENAPLTVLTLGRVVSLRDYEDFARAYAGIGKAMATWSWDGERRGVFITVAGPDGTAIEQSVLDLLLDAIRDAGDPHVALRVATYRKATFTTAYHLETDPAHEKAAVHAATVAALRDAFGFDARAFGQQVPLSDVIATIARVPGVVGVDVDTLGRTDGVGGSGLLEPLPAALPEAGSLAATVAAELLTLAEDAITPGEMT
jgi:predicted phage baseplate assembly protein